MIELIAGALGFKADHWAGNGKKMVGYFFLSVAILFPIFPWIGSINSAYGLLFIPIAFFCALSLRKWGIWGELFVNGNDLNWPEYKWFQRILSKIYGHPTIYLKDEEIKLYKVVGWALRYAIYGLPISILYGAYNIVHEHDFLGALSPFLLLPVAGAVRGLVYWYGLKYKDLPWCEKISGAVCMAIIASAA